jgi:hypothetical protein
MNNINNDIKVKQHSCWVFCILFISILKCGPGLLFIGLSWPSVQVELEMPGLEYVGYLRSDNPMNLHGL